MKKATILFVIISVLLLTRTQLTAQITLEHVYPAASLNLYMVNLEISGMKYLHKSDLQGNRFLKFYNLDHSLWKTIDCNQFPVASSILGGTQYVFDALYISETIFDCDSAVEFLYVSQSQPFAQFTGIYKENGTALLIADSCAPLVRVNIPQQFRPMYNTPQGTKLILSEIYGGARVYDVPCTLSTGIDQMTASPVDPFALNVYPNPSFYQSRIEYNLPKEINDGEIILTDINGHEVKRYKVDNSFSSLLVEQKEIPVGTYFYSLVANDKTLVSKKIILLR